MSRPFLYREDISVVLPRKFLEESVYAEGLEAFVLVCTDCLLINRARKTIYLAKRKSKPMSDWWFIGGRVFIGEEEEAALLRCLKRETGLEISRERLRFQTMKRYIFKNRQQSPQDKGCDSLCYIFSIDVADEEIAVASASLDPEEYHTGIGLQEFDPKKLREENVFPAIIDLYESIFPDRPVERPVGAEVEKDEWVIEGGRFSSLKYTRVRIAKPDAPSHNLGDILRLNNQHSVIDMFEKEGCLNIWDVHAWSKVSIMVGRALHIIHDNQFSDYLFSVYPDGTADYHKKKPRRPVKPNENYYAEIDNEATS